MENFYWFFMGNKKIQRFMAHEKTLTNKNPMKMPWNRMKPAYFFHGFLMIMKKPWIKKLFFHGVGIYGFLMGLLNSCPIKKSWFFRERSNINGSFSLPMNYGPRLFFMGNTKTWLPWKFSRKLFSTVKLNNINCL